MKRTTKILTKAVACTAAAAVALLMAPPAWMGVLPGDEAYGLTEIKTTADGDFMYYVEDGAAHIYSYTGSGPNVVVPDTIDGAPVTSIEHNAIGNSALDYGHDDEEAWEEYTNAVKTITLPASVTNVEDMAFAWNRSLQSVTFKNTSTTINIGEGAFASTGLTSFTIAKNMKFKDGNPFTGNKFKKFTVASDSPDYKALNGGKLLTNKAGTTAISLALESASGAYKMPSSVTKVGEDAFCGASIKSLTFGSKLSTIDVAAFRKCDNLKSVEFPKSLKRIGANAFGGCGKLSEVIVPPSGSKLAYVGTSAFFGDTSLKRIYVPAKTKNIESQAFGFYYDDALEDDAKISGFCMTVDKGSKAKAYAKKNGIIYIGSTKVSKLTSKKKSLKVKVKKASYVSSSKKAYKYQIAYKQKGKKSWKKVKVKSTTKTIKKLKKGKKYQVKVRTLKKKSGKTYYGTWSAVKTSKKIK